MWWGWENTRDSSGSLTREFREFEVEFTIHNDPGDFSDQNGLYLMVCFSKISGQRFYVGLQTDVRDFDSGLGPNRGKGMIFSRWGERDLSFTRMAPGGWTESSGHEGDFVGVRLSYPWGTGDYRVRIAPDGTDENGEWYGAWITDLTTEVTTWAGSLKFPLIDNTTSFTLSTYTTFTTLEIYGDPIRPIDIPEWHVSMKRPQGDGIKARWGNPGYESITRQIPNSDVQYDRAADVVHFRVGGATVRVGTDRLVIFSD